MGRKLLSINSSSYRDVTSGHLQTNICHDLVDYYCLEYVKHCFVLGCVFVTFTWDLLKTLCLKRNHEILMRSEYASELDLYRVIILNWSTEGSRNP